MSRLVLALLFLFHAGTDAEQALGVLHIKVVVSDSSGTAMPVPRHALLISDNPASAPPRRVLTTLDGTVDVRLAPGNYTVESDRPVAFDGKAYQWTQLVDVVAGRDAVIELTSGNAEVVAVTDAAASVTSPSETDPSSLLARWQGSLVQIWTATQHGSGFLIDPAGLVAADQQVIGGATVVEVQVSAQVKVAGAVIASDPMRGVALIRIDPEIAALLKPLPLECERPVEPLTVGQEIAALELGLGRPPGSSAGSIDSVLANVLDTDLLPTPGGTGGPAFAPNGRLIGLTTIVTARSGQRDLRGLIVRAGRICELVSTVAAKMNQAPPSAAHLPVELAQPQTTSTGEPARAGNLSLYRMSSSDFDITFITPALLKAAAGAQEGRTRDRGGRAPGADEIAERLLTDFANWSDYVAGSPPVLLVRVTPKLVEGFWTKVARGAAMTQGMAIGPIKRLKPDFASMRVFCGDAAVVPVHPFKLEHRVSDDDTLVEGLYAFDPGAIAPSCASVTLRLSSEKDPAKSDTAIVDAKVVERIWQDLAPWHLVK